MSKIVLDEITSGYQLSKVNENFQRIEDELNNKVLYRNAPDGEINTVEKDIDLNGKKLYNVGDIQFQGFDSLEDLLERTTTAAEESEASKDAAEVAAENAAISAASASTYSGSAVVRTFSGDGSTIAFNLTATPRTKENTQVYIGSVYQRKSTYSVTDNILTFNTAPPVGTNNIEVVIFESVFVPQSGYTIPVAYSSGIVLSQYNQLVEYNSEFYKLKAGQAPYTTTGTWSTDLEKLVAVGDAALRQELLTNANGFNLIPEVTNYAAVRAGLGDLEVVYVRGRENVFDGGAGIFRLKAGDTTTPDNGGTVLVDGVSGARYFRESTGEYTDARWFAKCDGVTNDSAVLQTLGDTLPEGSVITWAGPMLLETPVVFTRRVGIHHATPRDCIIVNTGAGTTGFSYSGPVSGINDVTIKLNVYGPPNCAQHAVRLARVDRSPNIHLTVYAGTTEHGTVLSGCLINRMAINSSANFLPPYAGMGFQAKHVRVTKTLGVAFNDNIVWVNLEGGGEGILGDDMQSEGNNTFYGCIEGLTSGHPIDLTGWMLTVIRDLHFEANAMAPIFKNCSSLTVGPNVLHALDGKPMRFENCRQPRIDGYYGEYEFDLNCTAPYVGRVLSISYASQAGEGYFMSAEQGAGSAWVGSSDVTYGGAGSFHLENLFHNPYMTIWDNGPFAAPAGCSIVGVGAVQKYTYPGPVYTDNDGIGSSAQVVISSTVTTDGLRMQCNYPHNKGRHGGHFMSFSVPLFVSSGNPDVIVFVYANGVLYDIGRVVEKNTWKLVRGNVRVSDGSEVFVLVRPWNFGVGTGVTGEFYVGGLSVVKGNRPAKFVTAGAAYHAHVVETVAHPPAFVGQEAYVDATGKWYKAKGVSSSADWIALN